MRDLVQRTREDNFESEKVLREKGLEFREPTPADRMEIVALRERIADALTGELFDQALRERVEALLAEHRARRQQPDSVTLAR